MRIVLSSIGLDRVWDVAPLRIDPASFASASAPPDTSARVQQWLTAAASANIGLLRRVVTRLSATVARDVAPELELHAELLAMLQALPEPRRTTYLCSTDLLTWISAANSRLRDYAPLTSIVRVLRQLPVLAPELCADVALRDFPVLLPPNVWPIERRWALRAPSTEARAGMSRAGGLHLRGRHWSLECADVPSGQASRGFLRPRARVGKRALEVTLPVDPYHRVWAHKFRRTKPGSLDSIVASVERSFDLLDAVWPEANSLRHYAQRLVAYVPEDSQLHNSASTEEFPFVQYAHVVEGHELANLCSYVHEAMHSKLAILMSAHSLHEHGETRAFRHPWMDVPRPAAGVFLGAHAFVNIMDLAHRVAARVPELRDEAAAIVRRRRHQVELALAQIDRMRLRPAGERLFTSMRQRFREFPA